MLLAVILSVGFIGAEPVTEKPPTWLSQLPDEEKGEKEFLKKLATSKDFLKLIEKAQAEEDADPTAVVKWLGEVQGQEFKLIIGVPRKEGALTRAFKAAKKPNEVAKVLVKDKEFTKIVNKTFDEAKKKAEAQRKANVAAPGFGHIFVEALNEQIAKTEGFVLVQPKGDPPVAN